MTRVFRKIRSQSLRSGKIKKALVYALGEILLVVIGILLAVQINNWNNARKARDLERITLTRLAEDLKRDQERYEFLTSSLKTLIQSCDSLQSGLLDVTIQGEDRLKLLDISFLIFYSYNTTKTTYQEMLNSGRLYNLSNPETRTMIAQYYRLVSKYDNYNESGNETIKSQMRSLQHNDYRWFKTIASSERTMKDAPWLFDSSSQQHRSLELLVSDAKRRFVGSWKNLGYLEKQCQQLRSAIDADL